MTEEGVKGLGLELSFTALFIELCSEVEMSGPGAAFSGSPSESPVINKFSGLDSDEAAESEAPSTKP